MTTTPTLRGSVRVTLPIRVVNESNQRDHWTARAARSKHARVLAGRAVRMHMVACFPGWDPAWKPNIHEDCMQYEPLGIACGCRLHEMTVTLTRITPDKRGTLDDDGLHSALKATRDGVADALGLDDRDPRVTWVPEQRTARRGATGAVEIGLVRGYGVEVRVEARR